MEFHEKLDLLMNITNTKNSALSLYTSLDASHISRLRRGERSLSKNENYVQSMSVYFAKHSTEYYQRKAIAEAIGTNSSLPDQQEQFSKVLYSWLLDSKKSEPNFVGNFLEGLSAFTFRKTPVPVQSQEIQIPIPKADTSIYYGNEGKRTAVVAFLSCIIQNEAPQTLYLLSEEDMDWLTVDPEFMRKWTFLMTQVLMRGNKIKIIHTVSRNLDEMLAAIREWMPLYMTGAIEPYYYPKKRDGVFKRTLFVAPGTAAVTSTSVGNDITEKAANYFLRDKKAIGALFDEFTNYLLLCRQLMRIFTPRDREAYLTTLSEFEREEADAIIKTDGFSIITMPPGVAKKIMLRLEPDLQSELQRIYEKRTLNFEKQLNAAQFTEIIRIPDIEAIKSEQVSVNFYGMLGNPDVYYTADEYKKHLEHIIFLLEAYDNFHVHISTDSAEERYMLYVKEDLGAIVGKSAEPWFLFAINEINMTAAFWDFLRNKISRASDPAVQKRETINQLQAVISNIVCVSSG
jgi:hypothetical protein